MKAQLEAGKLCCPACDGVVMPWGFARGRWVRLRRGRHWLVPPRVLCRARLATHVLLPASTLLRRLDAVEVIAAALVLKLGQGQGHRRIATRLGVPEGIVRAWLRRFAAHAELIRAQAIEVPS